jgi:hypothetical protein
MAKTKKTKMAKSELEVLAEKVERHEAIKAQVSALNKEAKEIMAELEDYLDSKDVSSVAVGDINVVRGVSGYAFGTSINGVKVSDAKSILVRELLAKEATHLMSINLKAAALFELQNREDPDFLPLMKKVGLVVTENQSVKIK